MSRTRYRDLDFPVQGIMHHPYNASYPKHTSTAELGFEKCEDVNTNFGGDNPLHLRKAVVRHHEIILEDRGITTQDHGTFVTSDRGGMREVHVAPLPDSLNNLAVLGLAKANPSQPAVSVPTILGELKELPRLIRSLGDQHVKDFKKNAVKKTADANLTFQFGMRPLISDVNKLLNFKESAERRFRELSNLAANGGLSRTRTVGSSYQVEVDENLPIYTQGPSVYAKHTIRTQSKTWVVSKWKASDALLEAAKNPKSLRQFANAVNAGLTSSGAIQTIWELVPWSFLVDYFTSMGDFLQAIDNSVAYQAGPAIICHQTGRSHSFEPKTVPDRMTYNPGESVTTSKQRFIRYVIYPSATRPALTNRQFGILTSLAVLQ